MNDEGRRRFAAEIADYAIDHPDETGLRETVIEMILSFANAPREAEKDQFMLLVQSMRTEQIAYFRHRETHHLQRSKDLERKVDKALMVANEIRQGTLFEPGK